VHGSPGEGTRVPLRAAETGTKSRRGLGLRPRIPWSRRPAIVHGERKLRVRPENVLVFYAAVTVCGEYTVERTRRIVAGGLDWDYLVETAVSLDTAGGLLDLLRRSGTAENEHFPRLREAMRREMHVTALMKSLFLDVSSLLEDHGVDYIPLKGCDPRISEGARGFFNVMSDIDVLVRRRDVERVGRLFEKRGWRYLGVFSGSHATFHTDERVPRFIELHWDLINRDNPVHSALFGASIEKIWERSVKMCAMSLLSAEDLLSYLVAHAVKEYFHKPKWLADIAWVMRSHAGTMEPAAAARIAEEWGTSKALGMVGSALRDILNDPVFGRFGETDATGGGMLGRYVSRRLLCYERLKTLRPLIFAASAGTAPRTLSVLAGMVRRAVSKFDGPR